MPFKQSVLLSRVFLTLTPDHLLYYLDGCFYSSICTISHKMIGNIRCKIGCCENIGISTMCMCFIEYQMCIKNSKIDISKRAAHIFFIFHSLCHLCIRLLTRSLQICGSEATIQNAPAMCSSCNLIVWHFIRVHQTTSICSGFAFSFFFENANNIDSDWDDICFAIWLFVFANKMTSIMLTIQNSFHIFLVSFSFQQITARINFTPVSVYSSASKWAWYWKTRIKYFNDLLFDGAYEIEFDIINISCVFLVESAKCCECDEYMKRY